MTIRDVAGNALPAGQGGQMIGFVEPPAAEEVLPLKAYQFLIEVIRTSDLNDGQLFMKRYFDGIQTVWEDQQAAIFSIKDLWSTTKIADGFLQHLKNIVGWTKELDHITKSLDATTLRRLIAASVPLWKTRGPEDAMLNVLRLTTGARLRMWNWFDYRWVLDETETGEEHQGRDPYIINLPGPPDYDEYRSTLRIVDDGALNRTLVEDLVKMMRAAGERVEVCYIDFLDLFNVDGDNLQWEDPDASPMTVANGYLALSNTATTEHVNATRADAANWANYVASWRIRDTAALGTSGVTFYQASDTNTYKLEMDIAANTLVLSKIVAGVSTVLSTYSFAPFGALAINTWYALRVQVGPDGANTRIKAYIDNAQIMDVLDTAFTKGSIGMVHTPNSTIQVDEVEMFQLPLDTVLIDINP